MKPAQIQLASVTAQYAPAGSTASDIPSIRLLPYRPTLKPSASIHNDSDPDNPLTIPTSTVIEIYNQVKEGKPLDTLLRKAIAQELLRHGYVLNLNCQLPIQIPKKLVDQIGLRHAGINIEYIETSRRHETGIRTWLWTPEDHKLTPKQIARIEPQLEAITRYGTVPIPQAFDPFNL